MRPLRRIAPWLLSALVALPAATGAIPAPHTALFWTAPRQPVEGAPTQVLFLRDIVNSTEVSLLRIEQEPGRIVLVYRSVCTGWCDTNQPHVFTETLPPLAAGMYVVAMAYENPDGVADHHQDLGSIAVAAESTPRLVSPAPGYWASAQAPGSGLFLEQRSGLLAVALYSYLADGGAFWWLGNAPLLDEHVLVPLQSFAEGACLGCATQGPPRAHTDGALRLRFESARRAFADVNGTEDIALVSVPYGVEYLDVALNDAVDATWGRLPLPDLRGTWLFALEEPGFPELYRTIRFDGLDVANGGAVFSASDSPGNPFTLDCRSADGERRAGCAFSAPPPIDFGTPPAPPRGEFDYGPWWFALGDIEEERMRGTIAVGEQIWHVRGFRLPTVEATGAVTAGATAGTPQ